MQLDGKFYWWRVADGVATLVPDGPEVCKLIDDGAPGYFGTIEGAIIYGGVKASAFSRKTEATFDALEWLKTGRMVRVGSITTTKITAEARP